MLTPTTQGPGILNTYLHASHYLGNRFFTARSSANSKLLSQNHTQPQTEARYFLANYSAYIGTYISHRLTVLSSGVEK